MWSKQNGAIGSTWWRCWLSQTTIVLHCDSLIPHRQWPKHVGLKISPLHHRQFSLHRWYICNVGYVVVVVIDGVAIGPLHGHRSFWPSACSLHIWSFRADCQWISWCGSFFQGGREVCAEMFQSESFSSEPKLLLCVLGKSCRRTVALYTPWEVCSPQVNFAHKRAVHHSSGWHPNFCCYSGVACANVGVRLASHCRPMHNSWNSCFHANRINTRSCLWGWVHSGWASSLCICIVYKRLQKSQGPQSWTNVFSVSWIFCW